MAKLFQFPYRMLSVTVIVSSFLVASALNFLHGNKLKLMTAVFIGVWAIIAIQLFLKIAPTSQPESYYTTNEATTTVANEYMPIWVHEIPQNRPPTPLEFLKGKGTFEHTVETTDRISTNVHAIEDSIIQINTIYYPGWGAMLDDARAQIRYNNPLGVMQIPVAKGNHDLNVEFRETIPRFIATSISFIITVAYVFWICIPKQPFASLFFGPRQIPTVSFDKKKHTMKKKKKS